MTCHQFSAAFTPNRNDVLALRAALAWVIALIVTPIRRAALEARLERAAVAARRSAMLNRSAPSGIGAVPTACDADGYFLIVVTAVTVPDQWRGYFGAFHSAACWDDATAAEYPECLLTGENPALEGEPEPYASLVRYTALPAILDVLTVAEPIQSALIDPPAAPAKPKRVRKPAAKKTAPKGTTVKAAANKPVKAPSKPTRTRKPAVTAAEPVKAPRKRKAAPKTSK